MQTTSPIRIQFSKEWLGLDTALGFSQCAQVFQVNFHSLSK